MKMQKKGNSKEHLIYALIDAGLEEVSFASAENEKDKIIDNIVDDCMVALAYRYTFRSVIPKSFDWRLQVLPRYDDKRFQQMVRVTREQFDTILCEIESHPVFHQSHGPEQLEISLQLSVVLYRLGSSGSSGSIRKIAAIFGIGDGGTIQKFTQRVFTAILSLKSKYLQWPDSEERREIFDSMQNELPGCIGYIDGSEVRLSKRPEKNHEAYFSRKKQYAVKVQGICDNMLKFRYTTIVYPGSVHDARIYSESIFCNNIHKYLSQGEFIAGDSAYKLEPTLITPYKNPNKVEQTKFNKHFSKYRVLIEHCFGIWKEKFPSMKELNVHLRKHADFKFMCEWMQVTLILHNMTVNREEENYFVDRNDTSDDESDEDNDNNLPNNNTAEQVRQYIYRTCIESELN